jgi:hypothetical protein
MASTCAGEDFSYVRLGACTETAPHQARRPPAAEDQLRSNPNRTAGARSAHTCPGVRTRAAPRTRIQSHAVPSHAHHYM